LNLKQHPLRWLAVAVVTLVVLSALALVVYQQRQQEPLSEWDRADAGNSARIDHAAWQLLLDDYLDAEDPSGVNLFDYENLALEALSDLDDYIDVLSAIDPRSYTHEEQFAYWINLYNAATVQLIATHYPIESITELGETALAFGPWDDPSVTVAGKSLSLNNIEHGILRPVFGDSRLHFAVNCASIGCPNLQPDAFTGENLDQLLAKGASEYMSHPRAVELQDGKLVMSSIFDWYAEDFGADRKAVLATVAAYCPPPLAEKVKNYTGEIDYRYDWQLNEVRF